MLTTQRKALILDILRRDGQVIAKRVAEDLSLSEDTIRRDLREMAAEGLLKRVHGGAMPLSPDLPDFTARRSVSSEIKARLGAAAAAMVKPGQMIFLDGGTTTAEIAPASAARHGADGCHPQPDDRRRAGAPSRRRT